MFKFLFLLILVFLVLFIFFPLKRMWLVGGKQSRVLSEGEKEKLVLRTVSKQNGRVTPLDIVADSPLSLEEVKSILDGFVSQAYADMNVTKSGLIVYEFPNFMNDGRKSTDTMF